MDTYRVAESAFGFVLDSVGLGTGALGQESAFFRTDSRYLTQFKLICQGCEFSYVCVCVCV